MSQAPALDRLAALKKARLAWAREVLKIPPEADPALTRRLVLARLAESDFVPTAEGQQAVETVLGRKRRLSDAGGRDDAFLRSLEERLGPEVERLAAAFFDLAPTERRARFVRLSAACGFSPVLRVRLKALEAGLKIDPSAVAGESPPVRRLVGHLCKLLVLSPSERASLRREVHRTMMPEIGTWQKAARRIRAAYPDIAAMDPDFVARLAEWSPTPARPAPASPADLKARREAAAVSRASSYRGYDSDWRFPWYFVVIAMLFVRVAIRGCDLSNKSSTPTPPRRTSPSYPNPFEGPDGERARREFQRQLRENEDQWGFGPKGTDRSDPVFTPPGRGGREKPSVLPPWGDDGRVPPTRRPTPGSPPRQPRPSGEGRP